MHCTTWEGLATPTWPILECDMTNESVARVIITFLQSRVHTDQKHGHHNMVVSGVKTNVVFTALCKFSGFEVLGCQCCT